MAYNKTLIYNELAELYPLWRGALLHGDEQTQKKQVKFLETILSQADAKTLIDLGGGIGTHSIPLSQQGYKVSAFDSSSKALTLMNKKEKSIKTIKGFFEKIALTQNFDASICMWSTINYLLKPKDRKHFVDWITAHTNRLIIIDQPNLFAYPKKFNKEYEVADEQRRLKISRNWEIKNQIRKTNYIYQITDKTGKTKNVKDVEIQYFMTLAETSNLIGKGWAIKYLLGDYDINKAFDSKKSSRLITVFEKVMPPISKPAFHGGDFFKVINHDFSQLENSKNVINADVLDAWFDPSPKVIAIIKKYLPFTLRTSPPTYSPGLINTISQNRKIPESNLLVGGGSSDLTFVFFPQLIQKNDKVLILDPMYGEYQHIFENVIGAKVLRYKLSKNNGFKVNVQGFVRAIKAVKPKAVVIVNPNSPTGQSLSRNQLTDILRSIPKNILLVVDETYIDYVGQSQSIETQVIQYDNLAVIKSMSKVYALSGVRVGYLAASEKSIAKIKPFIPPWAVSFQGQLAAIEALKDKKYYATKYLQTDKLRTHLIKALANVQSLKVYNSSANFILVELTNARLSARQIIAQLNAIGIFLRNCDSMSEQFNDNFIRISVRNQQQNNKIILGLKKIIGECL